MPGSVRCAQARPPSARASCPRREQRARCSASCCDPKPRRSERKARPLSRALRVVCSGRGGSNMSYDVVIVGGGPAGLSAALALGRGRKRVLLCDAGARRNATAERLHNFVTRDGTPPAEFRAIARAELAAYPNVELREARIEGISGARGSFRMATALGEVEARRILLCTGMIDEMLALGGFRELWGRSIFQCPYCHGWEVRDTRWAHLAWTP